MKVVGRVQVVPAVMTVLPKETAPSNTSMVAPNSPVPVMTGLAADAPVVVMTGADTALSMVRARLGLTSEVLEPTVWVTLRLWAVPAALAVRAAGVNSH